MKNNDQTPDFQEIQDLLKLKRYEKPRDGYFEDFLEEFHRRQSKDVCEDFSFSLLDQLKRVFQSKTSIRVAFGSGLAFAAILFAFHVPNSAPTHLSQKDVVVSQEPVESPPFQSINSLPGEFDLPGSMLVKVSRTQTLNLTENQQQMLVEF